MDTRPTTPRSPARSPVTLPASAPGASEASDNVRRTHPRSPSPLDSLEGPPTARRRLSTPGRSDPPAPLRPARSAASRSVSPPRLASTEEIAAQVAAHIAPDAPQAHLGAALQAARECDPTLFQAWSDPAQRTELLVAHDTWEAAFGTAAAPLPPLEFLMNLNALASVPQAMRRSSLNAAMSTLAGPRDPEVQCFALARELASFPEAFWPILPRLTHSQATVHQIYQIMDAIKAHVDPAQLEGFAQVCERQQGAFQDDADAWAGFIIELAAQPAEGRLAMAAQAATALSGGFELQPYDQLSGITFTSEQIADHDVCGIMQHRLRSAHLPVAVAADPTYNVFGYEDLKQWLRTKAVNPMNNRAVGPHDVQRILNRSDYGESL
jgi:hypothetical protein